MQASKASDEGKFDSMTFASVLCTIGWGLAMHVIFLILNATATKVLGLELREKKAVIISASQKTLPIAITVLGFLPVGVS
jgi:sodium/bile acid cotransporter 7